MSYRKPKLKQFKRVWLDGPTHTKLRELKKHEKNSMAQIIKDLVDERYKKSIVNEFDVKVEDDDFGFMV